MHFEENKQFGCNKCDALYIRAWDLQQHMEKVHEGQKILEIVEDGDVVESHLCSLCDYKAKSKILLKSHMKTMHDKIRYKCYLCAFQTSRTSNLKGMY